MVEITTNKASKNRKMFKQMIKPGFILVSLKLGRKKLQNFSQSRGIKIGSHLSKWPPLTPFPQPNCGKLLIYYRGDIGGQESIKKPCEAICLMLKPIFPGLKRSFIS